MRMTPYMTMNDGRGMEMMLRAGATAVVVGDSAICVAWQWASQGIRHASNQAQASQKQTANGSTQKGASR
jgi:3-deoxy-D-manno-octulosonate 8-phosphate phosphatase KdsC-like HAD superfamily phosphatase